MKPELSDSQFDERFGILKNKLGCVTTEDLTRKASEYATARLLQLADSPIPGRFDIPTSAPSTATSSRTSSLGPATSARS